MGGDNAQANGPFRVLLANDHTMFCQGLAGILAAYGGMEVVAEVPNDENNLRYVSWLSGGLGERLHARDRLRRAPDRRGARHRLGPRGGRRRGGNAALFAGGKRGGGDSVLWATPKWCIDAGLPVRMGCGRYDVTDRFSERLDDLWAAGHGPEADRLQIRDHNDQRDGHRNRGKVKAEPVSKRTTAELERVPDPGIVDALQRFLSRNLQRCDEEPGWFSVALWAEYHLPTKPTPLTVEVALGELHWVTA